MRPHRLVLAGFGAFANRAEVDFDKLSTHGLYLIIGETGSGKTTIFDAMTYALYGDVAGNRDSGSVASDYDNCDSPYVEFEFSHKQKRFLIKRKIKSADTSEQSISEISPDGKTINAVTGKTAVKNFVQELIGLDADQFMKVVLLPQGKFEKFLVANSTDRETMLQALFGTAVYAKVSESMIARSDQQVREASAVLQDLSSKEDSAQKFLQTLETLGYDGEIPDLQNGCEEPLRILKEQRGKADKAADSGQKLLTDAAKKLQAVTDEADLFNAGKKLAELVGLQNKFEKQVSAADIAINDHGKAKPVSQANESAKEANLKKETAEKNLQTIDSSVSEIIRSHKSNSIISAISKMRLDGVASVNAYIAKSKAHIEKAVLKNDQADELEGDAENANDEIVQDKKRTEEIKKSLKGLSEKLKKASAEQKIQQTAIAKLSNLKSKVAELDNLLEISNVSEAKSELKLAAAEFQRSNSIYDKAREALKSAHELQIRHLAGELGASLKSGKECPVCGSTDHPQKAKKSKIVNIEQLEAKRTAAQRLAQSAESELKRCEKQFVTATEAAKRLPTKESQLKLRAELKLANQASKDLAKTSTQVKLLSTQVANLESESAGLRSNLTNQARIAKSSTAKARELRDDANVIIPKSHIAGSLKALSEISRLVGKLEAAEKDFNEKAGKASQAAENIEKVLMESGFSSLAVALRAVKTKAELTELEVVVSDAKNRQKEITGLEGRVKGKVIPTELPDLKSAKDNLEIAKLASSGASKLANGLGQAISVVETLKHDQKTAGASAKEDLEFAQKAKELAERFKKGKNGIGGILGLERWVQRRLFKEVCNVGNAHLQILSKGRYQLTLDPLKGSERAHAGGLDLYVIDSNNGKTRQVQNLSGGETFLVALALALSLAEVVQSLFGGIELSSLFIDEGFGTLDSDTLELAVSLLETIRSDGRSIGIITHVDQMQKTLPIGMKIHKSPKGSSVEQFDLLTTATS